MEKLAKALSVIQQGMLRNNPGFVKDSVNEATEVLSGMLNAHKCLLESGVKIQKKMESHPAMRKLGIFQRPRSASLGDTPKNQVMGRLSQLATTRCPAASAGRPRDRCTGGMTSWLPYVGNASQRDGSLPAQRVILCCARHGKGQK